VDVRVVCDDPFGESGLDLVDDVTGRDYALPPGYFENSLRGTVEVEARRASPAGPLEGRARSHTDWFADQGRWELLRQ
jgi:hypothetical protein